uniref:Very-long-chain enoyl-CoA reductase n=1 Tax=Podarcis muralis TaxID=64176 RepID=A0A670K7F0_PODMU
MKYYEVEILDAKTREKLCFLDKVEPNATVIEIKNLFTKSHPQWYPARQSLRLDPKGKSLKDEDILQNLPVGTTATLYFRDLGAQISWVTVFLTEYAGPLLIYLLFYFRVPFIYGHKYDFTSSKYSVVHLACICHSFHYVKRLLETLFVHRFSHGTMPLRNIFKNCTYYWGFAAWMAYYINHPLYTPPAYGHEQVKLALIIFLFCQLGNFSIHIALRNLRPAGGILDWLCHYDSVPSSGSVFLGWIHPNDDLGKGETPKLPEGVPGLPAIAFPHCPFPALSWKPLPSFVWADSSVFVFYLVSECYWSLK